MTSFEEVWQRLYFVHGAMQLFNEVKLPVNWASANRKGRTGMLGPGLYTTVEISAMPQAGSMVPPEQDRGRDNARYPE